METLALFIWPALGIALLLATLMLGFVQRDFSGNDGCADDRKWPIVS